MSKITDLVRDFSEPVIKELGCEIWDVEYLKEAGEWFLRVYIDKEGGVSINDCVAVTHALDPILDEKDPIAESYTFEVCSAGLERQLKRPSDFDRFMGSPITLKLYKARDGIRELQGTLAGYSNGDVTMTDKNGDTVTIPKAEIAAVKLRIEF